MPASCFYTNKSTTHTHLFLEAESLSLTFPPSDRQEAQAPGGCRRHPGLDSLLLLSARITIWRQTQYL